MLMLLSALLATAPPATSEARESRPRHPSCAVVGIASDRTPRSRHGFRATRILELEFDTQLVGRLEHARSLQLRLYTPQGFLYQVLETPIDERRRQARHVEARLPVAGTSIMASGLYGLWKVVPHLDDGREPCGRARGFVIRP